MSSPAAGTGGRIRRAREGPTPLGHVLGGGGLGVHNVETPSRPSDPLRSSPADELMASGTRSHGARMREQRETAMGGTQVAGRAGAFGVLTAGTLCVAALSVPIPIPSDQAGIPEVALGSSPSSDTLPVVRQDGSAELNRRVGAHASDAGRERAARRRRGGPQADAHGRRVNDVGPGDRGAAGPAKPRRGVAPALPGRGGNGPGGGSPSGGQDGVLVPPSAGAQPVHGGQEAPEPASAPDTDEGPVVAPSSAASTPEDEPSDDPAPTGLGAPAPESDSDAA